MGRCLKTVAGSAVAGVALAWVAAWVVLGYGPESLFEIGDCVYDADGQYMGQR